MQEPEKRREEKLEDRDIAFGGTALKQEKQHGKLYRWFDNFWYHHKWKTIISLFLVIVVVVCTVQMCGRAPAGDMRVILCGPYNLMMDEAGVNDLKKCLANHLAADYDENGVKQVDISSYSVYSEAQIKAFAANVDENGDPAPIVINTQVNASNYQSFISYIQTGDASVMFLDPWLFEKMKNQLTPLRNVLETVPENAITAVVEEQTVALGICLGETALYRENTAMQVLPEDTVICLALPVMAGDSGKPEIYARAKEFYANLIK
ncbi:MAG: hypothetical protein E7585_05430 [Ruminococcaceae bacterium]|nr:hypothetical protein [Oscillospiraceae bacterium]